ncbi:hypothetical protein GCM10022278_30170 [Allohahella marinimesophila]|uniref:Outer membrane scaffolding protein for murein synthesis (MipA/OmpV family) n=2 Tax=Allohahella marinimesophila TaxID=1054972 RepID=A0ABP7PTA4_9GAMM
MDMVCETMLAAQTYPSPRHLYWIFMRLPYIGSSAAIVLFHCLAYLASSAASSLASAADVPAAIETGLTTTERKPLWELGLGAAALHQTYYTGTRQTRTLGVPVPLIIYRGEIFRSDNEGIRAELIDDERFELDLSFGLNLGIDSEDVDLRKGMDDTDTLFEIGPSLKITLAKTELSEWRLNLPLRVNLGFSSDGIDESGFTFAPDIRYSRRLFEWSDQTWIGTASAGVQFGTREFQNNYYGVEPEFASDERPAYEAESGFSGSRLTLTLRSKTDQRLIGIFGRVENISGASFEDSPLVETRTGFTVGLAFSWFFLRSSALEPG